MTWQDWIDILSMAATVAFAVTAVVAVRSDRSVDLFGVTVLGLITAIGGGTVRDVILDVRVFWADDLSYIWVACAASVLAVYGRRLVQERHLYSAMLYLDGFGAAMFAIIATAKVWDMGFGLPAAPVLLGVVTAIGGGLLRDMLAGRTTLLMSPEIYAVPVAAGCTAYVLILSYLPEYRSPGSLACVFGIFIVRAAAIHWNLRLPAFAMIGRSSQP